MLDVAVDNSQDGGPIRGTVAHAAHSSGRPLQDTFVQILFRPATRTMYTRTNHLGGDAPHEDMAMSYAKPADQAAPKRKDTLGCAPSKLRKDVEVESQDITFYRKCMDGEQLERIAMPACDRGFLVGVSLTSGHRRNIFNGVRKTEKRFERDNIYIRDFSEEYRADLCGNFDFVLVEVSRAFLGRLGDEENSPAIAGLTCSANQQDAVLGHLAGAVAACLETPGAVNALFIEQLGLTIGTHLVTCYGNRAMGERRIRGALSPAQEALAKELLMEKSRLGGSIAEIAIECSLSRAYFIRAFARTTGRTPHQWLLEQRIEQARQLITTTNMTLSEIALDCGFADQSHLSRVFLKVVGVSPSVWRHGALR